jgi:hypothetical protein
MKEKYYLVVTGKGKDRRILEWYSKRNWAVTALNHYILDLGLDCQLVVSSIKPPFEHGIRE